MKDPFVRRKPRAVAGQAARDSHRLHLGAARDEREGRRGGEGRDASKRATVLARHRPRAIVVACSGARGDGFLSSLSEGGANVISEAVPRPLPRYSEAHRTGSLGLLGRDYQAISGRRYRIAGAVADQHEMIPFSLSGITRAIARRGPLFQPASEKAARVESLIEG